MRTEKSTNVKSKKNQNNSNMERSWALRKSDGFKKWWLLSKDRDYLVTMDNGAALFMELRDGLLLKIWRDSSILKSLWLEHVSMIEKWSMVIGAPHCSVWCLILLWGGTERGRFVRKLLPACSATLTWSKRVVDPIYSDIHRMQLNL